MSRGRAGRRVREEEDGKRERENWGRREGEVEWEGRNEERG